MLLLVPTGYAFAEMSGMFDDKFCFETVYAVFIIFFYALEF